MSDALISLKRVSKRFGYRTIFKNINFSIYPQDFILLLGNNGAGKTTLLKIICALMRPTQGQIFFKNQDYKKASYEIRQNLGTISHESRLYGDLTAIENLKLFGTLYSVKNLAEKIEHALIYVELDYAKHLPVRTFSSGMTKRLAIAKLLLYEPKFLVLDEPYTGLDQNSVELFQDYLKQYHQQGGTILMVTHQFSLGLELSNRVIVLKQGGINQDVSVSEASLELCSQWLQQN